MPWKSNKPKVKVSNILDPIQDSLCSSVFDRPSEIDPDVKPSIIDWVTEQVNKTMVDAGWPDPELEDYLSMVLTGSLTTYQYSDKSDFDVSLFIDSNIIPEWDRSELIAVVVNKLDGKIVPGTSHPLQVYIVPSDISREDLYRPGMRSAYDLDKKQWIVLPEKDRALDVRNQMPELITYAEMNVDKLKRLLRFNPEAAAKHFERLQKSRQHSMRKGEGNFTASNVAWKWIESEDDGRLYEEAKRNLKKFSKHGFKETSFKEGDRVFVDKNMYYHHRKPGWESWSGPGVIKKITGPGHILVLLDSNRHWKPEFGDTGLLQTTQGKLELIDPAVTTPDVAPEWKMIDKSDTSEQVENMVRNAAWGDVVDDRTWTYVLPEIGTNVILKNEDWFYWKGHKDLRPGMKGVVVGWPGGDKGPYVDVDFGHQTVSLPSQILQMDDDAPGELLQPFGDDSPQQIKDMIRGASWQVQSSDEPYYPSKKSLNHSFKNKFQYDVIQYVLNSGPSPELYPDMQHESSWKFAYDPKRAEHDRQKLLKRLAPQKWWKREFDPRPAQEEDIIRLTGPLGLSHGYSTTEAFLDLAAYLQIDDPRVIQQITIEPGSTWKFNRIGGQPYIFPTSDVYVELTGPAFEAEEQKVAGSQKIKLPAPVFKKGVRVWGETIERNSQPVERATPYTGKSQGKTNLQVLEDLLSNLDPDIAPLYSWIAEKIQAGQLNPDEKYDVSRLDEAAPYIEWQRRFGNKDFTEGRFDPKDPVYGRPHSLTSWVQELKDLGLNTETNEIPWEDDPIWTDKKGNKVYEIDPDEENDVLRHGKVLGHCYATMPEDYGRKYLGMIRQGNTRMFAIRDKSGRPLATTTVGVRDFGSKQEWVPLESRSGGRSGQQDLSPNVERSKNDPIAHILNNFFEDMEKQGVEVDRSQENRGHAPYQHPEFGLEGEEQECEDYDYEYDQPNVQYIDDVDGLLWYLENARNHPYEYSASEEAYHFDEVDCIAYHESGDVLELSDNIDEEILSWLLNEEPDPHDVDEVAKALTLCATHADGHGIHTVNAVADYLDNAVGGDNPDQSTMFDPAAYEQWNAKPTTPLRRMIWNLSALARLFVYNNDFKFPAMQPSSYETGDEITHALGIIDKTLAHVDENIPMSVKKDPTTRKIQFGKDPYTYHYENEEGSLSDPVNAWDLRSVPKYKIGDEVSLVSDRPIYGLDSNHIYRITDINTRSSRGYSDRWFYKLQDVVTGKETENYLDVDENIIAPANKQVSEEENKPNSTGQWRPYPTLLDQPHTGSWEVVGYDNPKDDPYPDTYWHIQDGKPIKNPNFEEDEEDDKE